MKVSQMTTDQATDVMVRIVEPVTNIMHDKDVSAFLAKIAEGAQATPFEFLAENVAPLVTLACQKHRSDVYEVIAALSGKTSAEIGKQLFTQTISDAMDCVDRDLIDFFGSVGKSGKKM